MNFKTIGQAIAIIGGLIALIAALGAFLNWYASGKIIDVNQDNRILNLTDSIAELTTEIKDYNVKNEKSHDSIKSDVDDVKRALFILLKQRNVAENEMPYQYNFKFKLYNSKLLSMRH